MKILWTVMMAVALAVGVSRAGHIGVGAAGESDADLVERVAATLRQRTQLPVRVRDLGVASCGATADVDEAVGGRPAGEAVLLVLAWPDEEDATRCVDMPEAGIAAINVSTLERDADKETAARRVEREALRALGRLLGLESSPNPQCVMWTYTSVEELDAMGRGFDPPSLAALHGVARARGIETVGVHALPED